MRLQIKLPGCYPFRLELVKFTDAGVRSRPSFLAAHIGKIDFVSSKSSGLRLWLYFRNGYKCVVDAVIDRRPPRLANWWVQ